MRNTRALPSSTAPIHPESQTWVRFGNFPFRFVVDDEGDSDRALALVESAWPAWINAARRFGSAEINANGCLVA